MRDPVVHAEHVAALLKAVYAAGVARAAGPAGNRYGDPAGHACLAVSGRNERVLTVKTGMSERVANMHAFAAAALQLFAEAIA